MERIRVSSLGEAVELLHSLCADRSGEQAVRLCEQMKAAATPAEEDAAWLAFCRWAGACGLVSGDDDNDHHVMRAA